MKVIKAGNKNNDEDNSRKDWKYFKVVPMFKYLHRFKSQV